MKRTIVSALALSGALVLGACGSATNDSASGSGSKTAASQEAPAAASAKVGDTVELTEIADRSAAAVKEKGTAHMSMDMGKEGTMEADVDYRGAAPKMKMSITATGETMEMVYIDKTMYMGGASMQQLSGGKKWIKISADGKDSMSQMMGPLLSQMESAMGNPTEQLKAYAGAKATVSKVEDGATTYTVKLTKEQLAAGLKAQEQSLPGLTEEALKQMPDGVTYDITLDAEDLPTAVSMDLAGQKMNITYSKWGEPVDVKAPAASEVGTFEMPTS